MSAKFCRNCGEPLKAGARFCRKCGTKILETSPAKDPQREETVRERPVEKSQKLVFHMDKNVERTDNPQERPMKEPQREETARERSVERPQKLIIRMDRNAERSENPQDYAKYFNKTGEIG